MSINTPAICFINYPEPIEGPSVPYQNEDLPLPVLRGLLLAVGSKIVQNVGFIQSYLWRSTGFEELGKLSEISEYTPRYDPTVIPSDKHLSDITPRETLPMKVEGRKGDSYYYTSADYRSRYLSGELTPTAVVEALLPLIQRDANPPGKYSVAFIQSLGDIVRAAAAESTQRYKKGMSLGPLDGVPVAVKDEVDIKGYNLTHGTKLQFSKCSDETSWCVKKWEEAGAIVIGKTNMHELGLDTNNNNPNYGTPKNPWNPNFYCGGSSGGSGYTLAAGLVPIALGTDGGGSIRIPSSYCSMWGLKPTHNRVSAAPTPSTCASVGVVGPMASNLDDMVLAYRVMAAPPPPSTKEYSTSVSSLFSDPKTITTTTVHRPKTKKIGIFGDWIDRAEPAVRAVFDKALDYYRKEKSYEVIDISIPYLPEGQKAHVLTIMAEIAAAVPSAEIGKLLAPNKILVSMGMYQAKASDFLTAQRLRNLLMTHLAHLFQQHPGLLILTPTSPIPGWEISSPTELSYGLSDGNYSVRNMEYVYLGNFTGCPAISCPVGYDDKTNSPIGIMAMGEWGSEEDLISFGRDAESLLDMKVPSAKGSVWIDVLAEAEKKKDSA